VPCPRKQTLVESVPSEPEFHYNWYDYSALDWEIPGVPGLVPDERDSRRMRKAGVPWTEESWISFIMAGADEEEKERIACRAALEEK